MADDKKVSKSYPIWAPFRPRHAQNRDDLETPRKKKNFENYKISSVDFIVLERGGGDAGREIVREHRWEVENHRISKSISRTISSNHEIPSIKLPRNFHVNTQKSGASVLVLCVYCDGKSDCEVMSSLILCHLSLCIPTEQRKRTHQLEGARTGQCCGAVQNQTTHSTPQAHECVLRQSCKSDLYISIC